MSKCFQIGPYPATPEQNAIIQAALEGQSFKVMAFAGASKTTTLCGLSEQLTFKKILYIAFNKAIADEARRRFPRWVECRTAHSLAYRYVIQASTRLRDKLSKGGAFLPYQDLETYSGKPKHWRPFGRSRFQINLALSETLNQFLNSADAQVSEHHIPETVLHWSKTATPHQQLSFIKELLDYCNQLAEAMLDEACPCAMTHDGYLKLFQLRNPTLKYDLILLDEAQDTNPVLQAILEQQNCQTIIVGDRHQEIYGWRNAINTLDKMNLPHYTLTHSFRFGDHIAQLANQILKHLDEPNTLIGRQQDQPINQGFDQTHPYAVMCRTNAKVFEVAEYCLKRNIPYSINGGLEQVMRLMASAYGLYKGDFKAPHSPELSLFYSWNEFNEAAEEMNKSEWKTLIRFVETHKDDTLDKIQQLGQHARQQQAHVFISTVHKAKGLGFDQVVLASDFEWPEKNNPQRRESLNVIYVAITRAQRVLVLPKSLRSIPKAD